MNAPVKEAPEMSLAPSATGAHSQKMVCMNQEAGPHQTPDLWCFDLGLSVLQNCDK